MKESEFVEIFKTAAKEIFHGKLIVKKGANLLYELTLNRKLELSIKDTANPKRGQSAFQTDICIFEKINSVEYPRVVIEFKTNITTHDIITYSAKAGRHKRIYPGLRYGLLASEIKAIPNRFFIHNENIDFFITAEEYKDEKKLLKMIKELVEKEISTSRTLEKIYYDDSKFNYYRTEIAFGNFN